VTTSQVTAIVHPFYRQFYLRRGSAPWATDGVSSDGYGARLEAIGGFVYVGTTMYGSPTVVTVEVRDDPPALVHHDGDHVVEVSVAGEGLLALFSWGADHPEETVDPPPGPLRLRGSWTGMAAARADPDYEAGTDRRSPERVAFQVWAAPIAPRAVLRAWAAP